MVVEPFADDRVEDNLNPIGRVFYSASTMICVPGSMSQEVGLGLGTQAGESRLREVLTAGGFPSPARNRDPVQFGPRSPPVTGWSRLISDKAAVLDYLHRHAVDVFRRGGLRLRRHLFHVHNDRGLTGLISDADSGADRTRDIHQLILMPVARSGCRIDRLLRHPSLAAIASAGAGSDAAVGVQLPTIVMFSPLSTAEIGLAIVMDPSDEPANSRPTACGQSVLGDD